MTIEISRDDLQALAEAAKANTGSLMLMLKSTDGKRVQLIVTAPARRIRTRRVIGIERPAPVAEASAD
jgi:hypothetical protein